MSAVYERSTQMSSVYPTWIDGPTGKLFAMVHEPDPQVDKGAAIVMPSAGQDSRTGPQRLYLKAAREFAAAGFRVVRLDLAGTGDSVAENPKIALDSHAAEDVEAGVRWARESWDVEQVFLVALCAGARVAIRFAAHSSAVDGLVAWSVPTLSEGDTPYLNAKGLKKAIASRRLLTTAWWKNRWEYGLTELRQIGDAAVGRLADAVGLKKESYFIRCMDKYLSDGRPAQFVFGALDKIVCADFEERFSSIPKGKLDPQGYWILPDAVHALSSVAAHEAVIELSRNWLEQRVATQTKRSVNRPVSVVGDNPVPT